jgi:beta-galactosidase
MLLSQSGMMNFTSNRLAGKWDWAAALVAVLMGSVAWGGEPRVTMDLNPGWKFIRQDVPGAQAVEFDDSAWGGVALPHTWNNLDGEDGGDDYYRGVGWYRRHLDLRGQQAQLGGKSLFLRFDGASITTDVYVNGKSAGLTHKGMFGAFCYNVTGLLDPAGDNVIAVRVSNARDANVAPLSADFTFYGGLYRSVRLLALDPLSITPLDDAGPGVYVKQSNVSVEQADLEITTKLRNAHAADRTATVRCKVLDATGGVAGTVSGLVQIGADDAADAVQRLTIEHPHLWNARMDPYLYHVEVTVWDGGQLTDREVVPLGLRFFRVDPDRGFFLNGQSYPLHGVNRHQDRQDMGWAIGPKEHEEDFNLIMEMGCTGIRLSHYEQAQEFYDLCDRGGLVAWAEVCLVNSVTVSPAFDENAKQQLRELIKQNYNHPAICFWGMFNELGEGKDPSLREAGQKPHQIELVRQLSRLAKRLDPTRLTTAASNLEPDNALHQITDVMAFNRYYGWYSGSNADWGKGLDAIRAALPGRANGISEYGAGASVYEHELNPSQPKTSGTWHPEEWQCITHEQAYAAMKQRPWIWGTFLWAMFDFGSDGRHEGDHLGINDKGLVTFDRKIKKDAFFFYKANWSSEPFVHINDQRFTPRNVSKGPVKVYSNCDSVELKVNGQSAGVQSSEDHVFVWPNVTLRRGGNELEAIGIRQGRRYVESARIVYDPGALDWRAVARKSMELHTAG